MCIQWLLYTSHKYCCLPNVYFDHLAYVLNDFCTLVISTCLGGRWWPDYFMISGGTISCFLIQHVDKIILYFMFQHLMTVWGSYLLTLRPIAYMVKSFQLWKLLEIRTGDQQMTKMQNPFNKVSHEKWKKQLPRKSSFSPNLEWRYKLWITIDGLIWNLCIFHSVSSEHSERRDIPIKEANF